MDLSGHQGLQDESEDLALGILPPGTTQTVGQHEVVILDHLGQGGKSHIYKVSLGVDGPPAVLKRIAVADRAALEDAQRECRIHQQLTGHTNILPFLASAVAPLANDMGFEVFILTEFCSTGNLVELLNRRLKRRLEEREILRIYKQVCLAVAHMHYQDPPILHRDLKVENILIANDLSRFLLSDFGSCTTEQVRAGATLTGRDVARYEDDIHANTTLEYRAPELIDLYLRYGLTEKMDIWAIGVLLYKLCYLVTPFEEAGELAILNVQYTLPASPVYTEDLKHLIRWTLQEDPARRPTIYQLTAKVCALCGDPCPIKDIYLQRPTHTDVAPPAGPKSRPTSTAFAAPPARLHPAPQAEVNHNPFFSLGAPGIPTVGSTDHFMAAAQGSDDTRDIFATEFTPQDLEAASKPMRRGRPTRGASGKAPTAVTPPGAPLFTVSAAAPPLPSPRQPAVTKRSGPIEVLATDPKTPGSSTAATNLAGPFAELSVSDRKGQPTSSTSSPFDPVLNGRDGLAVATLEQKWPSPTTSSFPLADATNRSAPWPAAPTSGHLNFAAFEDAFAPPNSQPSAMQPSPTEPGDRATPALISPPMATTSGLVVSPTNPFRASLIGSQLSPQPSLLPSPSSVRTTGSAPSVPVYPMSTTKSPFSTVSPGARSGRPTPPPVPQSRRGSMTAANATIPPLNKAKSMPERMVDLGPASRRSAPPTPPVPALPSTMMATRGPVPPPIPPKRLPPPPPPIRGRPPPPPPPSRPSYHSSSAIPPVLPPRARQV
ncbi:Ark- serine/threonine protein kinase [Tieghemiomyces parasiticus]|uniref:non-specific serine/threonine protein kinase n=1 Tax=Tieghemiomyces parasiticus TaxID=78921 RepID=A0A9W8AHD9_9FUNG|nr:Ark- serine/threonine protein kinase [Tieghemiomyces parasiticus]